MRNPFRSLLLLCAALLVSGCSAVYTVAPMGETPVDIEAEKDAWDGTWAIEKGAITVQVVDGAKGVLKMAWIEEKEGKLRMVTADLFLRDGGGWTFASMIPEGERANRYFWVRIMREGSTVRMWMPKPEAFRKLIEAGRLPGELEGRSDAVVGRLTAEQLRTITTSQDSDLFERDSRAVFRMLGR